MSEIDENKKMNENGDLLKMGSIGYHQSSSFWQGEDQQLL